MWRRETPHVLGALFRRYGDFTACEDATQEALLAAAGQWPRDGVPDTPRAWLVRVASRRLIDDRRSDTARRNREDVVAAELNRAGAEAMAATPAAGLALLDPLVDDPALRRYHRLHAVRAHLLESAGRISAADEAYALATNLTSSVPEQRYLNRRRALLAQRRIACRIATSSRPRMDLTAVDVRWLSSR